METGNLTRRRKETQSRQNHGRQNHRKEIVCCVCTRNLAKVARCFWIALRRKAAGQSCNRSGNGEFKAETRRNAEQRREGKIIYGKIMGKRSSSAFAQKIFTKMIDSELLHCEETQPRKHSGCWNAEKAKSWRAESWERNLGWNSRLSAVLMGRRPHIPEIGYIFFSNSVHLYGVL